MTSPSLAISFARADATRRALLLEMMREFYAYEHLAWDEAVAGRGLDCILGDASLGEVWIVLADGEPAGYFVMALSFSLEFHGRYGFLDELFLRERFRGGGIGRLAVQHAAEVCGAIGARALRLEITATNPGARAFYDRLGFEDVGRTLLTKWIPSLPTDG